MKTRSVYLLTTALVLPLLFLVMGCDVGGGPMEDVSSEVAWFKVDCFTQEGTTQMVFEITGAVTDQGTIEGNPLPESGGTDTWYRYRILQGERGVLALRISAHSLQSGSRVAAGSFTILGGSDDYAGLHGQGDFHATLTEEDGLMEFFERPGN